MNLSQGFQEEMDSNSKQWEGMEEMIKDLF